MEANVGNVPKIEFVLSGLLAGIGPGLIVLAFVHEYTKSWEFGIVCAALLVVSFAAVWGEVFFPMFSTAPDKNKWF